MLMQFAGSFAAAVQGPAVASGSWFAAAQSAAMGGWALGTVGSVGGWVSAGAVTVAGALKLANGRSTV